MEAASLENLAYLLSAVLFIVGLKGLTHPRSAVAGNIRGMLGMALAIAAVLVAGSMGPSTITWWAVILPLAVGTAIGVVWAKRVPMTGMPELVAMFNGFGGIASALVAGGAMAVSLAHTANGGATLPGIQATVATALSGLIGGVTFTGSVVAYFKLQNVKWIPDGNLFAGQRWVNLLLLLLCLGLGAVMTAQPDSLALYALVVLLALGLGILLVSPIGGADMPVVIALLNSYSGLAACATGFVISNNVLIVAGSLVGASGLILTRIMCKAMNRSLAKVIFGRMGPTGDSPTADEVYAGRVKAASAEEIAMLLEDARRVVIVPGYGMAVSQAQHAVRDLANALEARGCTVEYAIHPVAGRMPGHMNVLLAEADVPYDKLIEMDVINPTLEQVDVAIVVGANDVVNPAARTDPQSPIAGMPIVEVDKCRTVVVVKRSLSPGFAGIPNPLFAADHTLMFFSDAKKAFVDLLAALKGL